MIITVLKICMMIVKSNEMLICEVYLILYSLQGPKSEIFEIDEWQVSMYWRKVHSNSHQEIFDNILVLFEIVFSEVILDFDIFSRLNPHWKCLKSIKIEVFVYGTFWLKISKKSIWDQPEPCYYVGGASNLTITVNITW